MDNRELWREKSLGEEIKMMLFNTTNLKEKMQLQN